MAFTFPVVNLLLVDDDELLAADAGAFCHAAIDIVVANDVASARRLAADRHFQAVAVNVGLTGGFDLIEMLAANSVGSAVIAIAAYGLSGRTLEHTLTIAELRGANLALPKPIDAIELVVSAIAQISRSAQAAPGVAALKRGLDAMVEAA